MKPDYKVQNEIISAIHQGDEQTNTLRLQIKKLNHRIENNQYRGIHPVTMVLVAAMLVILGLSAVMFYLSERQPRAEMLFEKYYEPFTMSTPTRGEAKQNDFERALMLYANHDYSDAVEAASAYGKKSPEAAYFMIGLCYLQMGLPDLAIKNFDLAEQNALYFKESIWWYKALTFIKKNECQVAEVILKKLIPNNNPYTKEATELLEKIGD